MEEEKVILTNWSPSNPVILSSDLGWTKDDCLDAESTDPKTIFNFFWKHFSSIIFYFPKDGNFYELFMEGSPFKFWRIKTKSDWNGQWIIDKINWNEHEEGEVLLTFSDDSDLWNSLKVDGMSIGDVISNSIIAEINM